MSLAFVRKATPFDAPKIYNLIVLAYAEINSELNLPGGVAALKETSADILRDLEHKTVLVCTKNGKVVGTVRYQVFTDASGAKIAYISRLCVLPEEQHSGIGSQMLQEVELQCRALKIDALALHTPAKKTKLVMFYYKSGFYIRAVSETKGYARGLFYKELTERKADLSVLEGL
ncbi:GNAT family N-acetyltransferase [Acetanaerobacterium elongatum]|uniref:N-acetylglutamate synthase, GNAT family n=1 Tax=Acetanaerobacterium elongatum TaxID=258515 RepID=A0A1H0EQ11_9FIRM|nr:GNAT family N-acetyltransferase [Acetanaerobacterium elongatum]SDN84383.1 N-acetylglutamate synthase, GNAT family [Acetanaerobacterium elongatum]